MNNKEMIKQIVIGVLLMALGYGVTTWMIGGFSSKTSSASPELDKALAALSKGDVPNTDPNYQVGQQVGEGNTGAMTPPPSIDAAFKSVEWDALIPEKWDPMSAFRGMNFADLKDNDPKAQEALNAMRKAWNEAPINPTMNGRKVSIPGFAIPVEQSDKGVSEFLLVPYFGACIHTPPPPANQIIHVKLAKPEPAIGSMQPYWVWGELRTQRVSNELGDAAYQIVAQGLLPYGN